jgi:hypothetical protein
VILWLLACAAPTLSEAELWDPASCVDCHPVQHAQWSGSMHAYASTDPVFIAMNARGQRETGGELGDFCVRCHAPGALALGKTEDGTNLDEVEAGLQGVGCAACHLVEEVEDDHNNALRLAIDGVLRAGIAEPADNTAHASAYSPLHDRDAPGSSETCGSCHDVVLDNGLHLERTFAEWEESLFSSDGPSRLSCGHCHMPGAEGTAALDGPIRTTHDHAMPGVDIAITDFPQRESQRAAVQKSLDDTLITELCVLSITAGSEITVRLENVGAGHRWPSGATHDRRAWVKLTAWADNKMILSTGDIPEGTPLTDISDERRWDLHGIARDADGEEARMFWDAASLEERSLPVATTLDPLDPDFAHTRLQRWPLPGVVPDRVEVEVLIRPIGLDILADLADSGDLDPALIAEMPTFSLAGAKATWQGVVGSCVP